MKPLCRMIVSLLVLPGPVVAQTPTPADLVGTWVWDRGVQFNADTLRIFEQYFTFAADSTYKQGTIVHSFAKSSPDSPWAPVQDMVQKEKKLYLWELRGDTLMFGRGENAESHPIALQGQRLKMRLGLGGQCDDIMERRDLTKPAIMLPPATFKRADLAGTWVRDAKEQPDTLWLKADGTLRYVGPTSLPNDIKDSAVSGTNWDVALDDYLYLPYKYPNPQVKAANTLLGFGPMVVRESNQPVIVTGRSLCSNSTTERKYKRIGP